MNAEEVARLLGINDKTVRRHLKKGTIEATRKASGELKISDDQVEKLRQVLELEDEGRPVYPMGRPVQNVVPVGRPDVVDLSIQVTTLTKELGKLQARVDVQQARITELERRVNQLETRPQNVVTPPTSIPTMEEIPPTTTPQNRSVERIEEDMLSAREFAAQLGISWPSFEGIMRHGIGRGEDKEYLERTEVPIAAREGYTTKYFSPSEQEKARETLKRHGKIK